MREYGCKHPDRIGTAAQCADCPVRAADAARKARLAASRADREARQSGVVAVPEEPAAEESAVLARSAHTPGLITEAARQQAQEIIDLSMEKAERVLTRHVAFPNRTALDIILLWLAHANARERDGMGMPGPLIWRATPRLLLTSAVNGSGKSTLLTLAARLAGSRFGRQSSITAPGFAAMMSQFNEGVFLDDAKNVFGRGEQSRTLQGHILNGYTPDVVTFDARKGGTARNLFGVVAYAGNDDLITAATQSSMTDLLARSIIIRMKRPNRFMLDIDDTAMVQADFAQRGMAHWAYVMAPELKAAAQRLSQEAADSGLLEQADVDAGTLRKVQLYRPLIACADVMGGDWPERARTAASTGGELASILADFAAAEALSAQPVTFTDDQ